MIDRLIARDATVVSWREASRRCIAIRAELAARQGAAEEAWALAREMLGSVEADQVGATVTDPFRVALAHKLAGDIFWRTGDRAGAIAAWRTGLAAWPKAMTETPNQLAQRGEMLRGIGQRAEGARIASQLTAMGYRLSISNRARI